MNEHDREERLADSAKQLFDDSVESIDAATLSRLNQGRHAALAELQNGSAMRYWSRWLPATGIAAAALIAVMIVGGPDETGLPAAPVAVSDFEILLNDEPLEMLEDLEFYSWINNSDLTGSGDVG